MAATTGIIEPETTETRGETALPLPLWILLRFEVGAQTAFEKAAFFLEERVPVDRFDDLPKSPVVTVLCQRESVDGLPRFAEVPPDLFIRPRNRHLRVETDRCFRIPGREIREDEGVPESRLLRMSLDDPFHRLDRCAADRSLQDQGQVDRIVDQCRFAPLPWEDPRKHRK